MADRSVRARWCQRLPTGRQGQSPYRTVPDQVDEHVERVDLGGHLATQTVPPVKGLDSGGQVRAGGEVDPCLTAALVDVQASASGEVMAGRGADHEALLVQGGVQYKPACPWPVP
ncbi:hypothetical protein BIV25_43040 [Streptomyces sp. MUSC 14]|nr:hypothetical protein BIV25_43040 [Streptomyces sp. MUSC 14]